MSSAICYNLDLSKILSSGKWVKNLSSSGYELEINDLLRSMTTLKLWNNTEKEGTILKKKAQNANPALPITTFVKCEQF